MRAACCGATRGDLRLAATACSPAGLPVFTQSQNSIALTWLEVGRKSYGKQPLSPDTPMLAVLRSHRSPRHLCRALATCLALIASGCGGGGYGGSSSGGGYNPMPAISSLAPASASAGAAAQTLTINGAGFVAASTVTYDGAARTATYVSASQLTVQLTAADQMTAGSYAVVVTNPAPGGGSSNSVTFTVTASNPMPAVTSLSPPSATAGAAGQTLTINGSGFMATSTVTYNGVPHTAAFVSATQLTIQLTAADQAMLGSYAVIVTNPPPGGGASASVSFTVGNPVPVISGLMPASVTAGTTAPTLTISGSGFLSSSSVTYNSVPHTATFVSASQLTISLTSADQATVGSYSVVVTNPSPGGGASNTATFTVAPVVPATAAVLVVGGQTTASMAPLTSGEIFASAAFTSAGNMSAARYQPTASLISAGATILITGGANASGSAINTAETFQVASKAFGATTVSMLCAHKGHTASVLQNGKVRSSRWNVHAHGEHDDSRERPRCSAPGERESADRRRLGRPFGLHQLHGDERRRALRSGYRHIHGDVAYPGRRAQQSDRDSVAERQGVGCRRRGHSERRTCADRRALRSSR
ncbi:MAG: hypothetical protein E6K27_09070 [Gammaproteobacteria bacterium]|nr:MAG: hypothetical protein E6K27_09070 [Gammaproteobacteria bacterium]